MRLIEPLENKENFDKLADVFYRILSDKESFTFLSNSLVMMDRNTIRELTNKHKESGIDYVVYEAAGMFAGVMAINEIL